MLFTLLIQEIWIISKNVLFRRKKQKENNNKVNISVCFIAQGLTSLTFHCMGVSWWFGNTNIMCDLHVHHNKKHSMSLRMEVSVLLLQDTTKCCSPVSCVQCLYKLPYLSRTVECYHQFNGFGDLRPSCHLSVTAILTLRPGTVPYSYK